MSVKVLNLRGTIHVPVVPVGYAGVMQTFPVQPTADPLIPSSFVVPIYTDPHPEIVSVIATDQHVVYAEGLLGPVTSDLVPLPTLAWYWEIETSPGVYENVTNPIVDIFPIRETVSSNWQIPVLSSLKDKYIRLVARAVYDFNQVWKSTPFQMLGREFDNSTWYPPPLPQPLPPPAMKDVTTGRVAVGVYVPKERDFSERQ